MNAHAAHPTDDLLSAYLDGELREREARRVADHVAACPSCRTDLDALGRVARALGRLERASPPPLLAELVERRVALEERRPGLLDRLESQMRGGPIDSPLVVSFAIVLTLAVVLYVFHLGVATVEQRQTPPARDGVTFEVAPTEAARELIDAVGVRTVAGRDFRRAGGGWREVAAGDRPAEATWAAGSPEGRELVAREPWLDELLADGEAVTLVDGDRIVEVKRAAEDDAPGSAPSP